MSTSSKAIRARRAAAWRRRRTRTSRSVDDDAGALGRCGICHRRYPRRMGRSYETESVVLRSMRFSEADRMLHLFTLERGRVNAIAKGVRKTSSRFGARLEPLTRSSLMLHEGRGELHTVSGADIMQLPRRSSGRRRPRGGRPDRGRGGAQAVRRAGAAPRHSQGLCRFLDLLAGAPSHGDPTHDAAGLGFQLKLLAAVGLSAAPRLLRIVRCPRRRWPDSRRRPAGPSATGCLGRPRASGWRPGRSPRIEGLIERPLEPAELTRGRHGRRAAGGRGPPTSITAASACARCTRPERPRRDRLIA